MKNLFTVSRSLTGLLSGFLLFSNTLVAQSDITEFLKAGILDANILSEAYISPFGKAFGASMNSGWYNTAKAHKPLGFDFTFSLNVVQIPSKFQSYDFNKLNLEKLKLVDPAGESHGSTVFGENHPGPSVSIMMPNPLYGITPNSSPDTALTQFELPQGIGYNLLPMPNLQLRLGIYQNTDLTFRFVPAVSIPGINGEVSLMGIGLMHDIKQWIPGWRDREFDLSVQGAWSNFRFGMNFPGALKADPEAIYEDETTPDQSTYDNQNFSYDMAAWNAHLLISKKLGVITFYGGLGYGQSQGKMAIKGTFPIPITVADPVNYSPLNVGKQVVRDYDDPINLTMNQGGFRGNIGFRLKLAIFTLHADYTLAEFPIMSAGLGLTVR